MIFYGRKSDVSKLVSFDVACEVIYANMAPEQFYFAPSFYRELPIFRSFFQLSAPYAYDDRDWARRFIVQHMASDFFLQVWLTYLLCLDRYFRISFDEQTRVRAGAEHASLRDLSLGNILFRNKSVPCLSFHPATHLPLLETETCISAILNDVFGMMPMRRASMSCCRRCKTGRFRKTGPRALSWSVTTWGNSQ